MQIFPLAMGSKQTIMDSSIKGNSIRIQSLATKVIRFSHKYEKKGV